MMKSASIKINESKPGKNPAKGSSGVNLTHEIYVREAIEAGLIDSKAGRTKPVSAVRKRFGLVGRKCIEHRQRLK